MSRRKELTPEVAREIVLSLEGGVGQKRAAGRLGISDSTLRRWRREGEAEPDGPYGQFAHDCLVAEEKAVHKVERNIFIAIDKGDTKAAMWWLSKKLPAEYGDKMLLETKDVGDGVPMDKETKDLVQATLKKLREHATKAAKSTDTEAS